MVDVPDRQDVSENDRWNLTAICESPDKWEKDYLDAEQKLEGIKSFQGRLSESAATLHEALSYSLGLKQQVEKLYTYAHLLSDEDTGDMAKLAMREKGFNLYMRYSTLSSFIPPEITSMDPERLNQFLRDDLLAEMRRMIGEIVRYKPHILTEKEENLLAMGAEVFSAPAKIFSQLNNADLLFGEIEIDGQKKPLTHGTFSLFLKHKDRGVRKEAFDKYYAVFDSHKNTIGASLAASVQKDVFVARARNYPSALEYALFQDEVGVEVYESLIGAVSGSIGVLHDYYAIRKKSQEIDDFDLIDTYVPLVPDIKVKHSFNEACDIVCEALKPLGREYVNILRGGFFKERWVDKYENKGKRSGAYSAGCYGVHPYILMNYKEEDLTDLFTLAHEAGHAMHSHFSNTSQKYQDHEYTIFVAEVASTFNEHLLMKYMMDAHSDNKDMVKFLINHQIDGIKATLFRQTMFAEFEKIIHKYAENNHPLTVDLFRSEYGGLLRKYFGPSVGISDLADLEALRIPHFYSAFYVYKYATGISAALALAERVLEGGNGELNDYMGFLKGGCSHPPLELLKRAGVDMTSPQPVKKALENFALLVNKLSEFGI